MEIIRSVLDSLGFDPVVFGSQVILFYLMHLLLKPILYRPLESSRSQRDALTMGKVEEAEQINRRAQVLKENYEEEIRLARLAAQATVAKARAEAEADRARRLAAANEEAQAMLSSAREEIHRQRLQAEAELDREVEGLSMSVASRLLKTMASPPQSQRVLERLREVAP